MGIDGEPRSLTLDEGIALWGPDAAHLALASNSRISSAKARAELGWAPRRRALSVS